MRTLNHSRAKVAAYVQALKRANAPTELIIDFEELVEIDNGLAEEPGDIESLDRLVLHACRRHGFAGIFDKAQECAWLRPSTISRDHDDYRSDTGPIFATEKINPEVEQAYRRGYDQGFHEAMKLTKEGSIQTAQVRAAQIHKWRRSPVYFGSSPPGSVDAWGIKVAIRTSLPAKRRYDVLERDDFRCAKCGRAATQGVVLHVDHVTSVRNGGIERIG